MDRFNEIWKNRFNEGDMPVGDWNTPDDAVWESILPHAPVKKDRRWLFLIILVLSLLGIGALSFYLSKTLNSISDNSSLEIKSEDAYVLAYAKQEKVRRPSQEQNPNSTKQEIEAIETESVSPNETTNSVSQKIRQNKYNGANVKDNTFANTINKKTESRGFVQDMDDHMIQENHLRVENHILEENLDAPIILDDSGRGSLPGPLSELPTFLLPVKLLLPEAVLEPIRIEFFTPKKKRLKVALNTGATYWQHKISSAYQNDLAPFDFNYSDATGWMTGLNVQLEINNYLDVYAGLHMKISKQFPDIIRICNTIKTWK